MPDLTLRSVNKDKIKDGKQYLFITKDRIWAYGLWDSDTKSFPSPMFMTEPEVATRENVLNRPINVDNLLDVFELPIVSMNHSTIVP